MSRLSRYPNISGQSRQIQVSKHPRGELEKPVATATPRAATQAAVVCSQHTQNGRFVHRLPGRKRAGAGGQALQGVV
eukprot:2474689-Prymnesium_polylepis.1